LPILAQHRPRHSDRVVLERQSVAVGRRRVGPDHVLLEQPLHEVDVFLARDFDDRNGVAVLQFGQHITPTVERLAEQNRDGDLVRPQRAGGTAVAAFIFLVLKAQRILVLVAGIVG
jgi:hypothetical protein